MKQLKIVIIGAGSATFGSGVLADLFKSIELKEFDLRVCLVDIDEVALRRMHKLAQLMAEHFRSGARMEAHTDRTLALPDANYVITSVAQHRWDLWEKDFFIPISYGFKQVFGENGGPGAAFHTLRSLDLMIPICRDIERLCPDALLINFTNPESRVCMGISQMTSVKNVGLCHGPMRTLVRIGEILGKPVSEIALTVAGINHFHWALRIEDRDTGKDLMETFRERAARFDWGVDTLTPLLIDLFGYITYPAPSHPGEYLRFAWDTTGPKYLDWGMSDISHSSSARADERLYRVEGLAQQPSYELWSSEIPPMIDRLIESGKGVTDEFLQNLEFPLIDPGDLARGATQRKEPHDAEQATMELTVPIICDIEFDRRKVELAANVLNTGRAITNLPEDAVVEVPIRVGANGIEPVPVGPMPEALSGLCAVQISIQKLLAQAYQERSKQLLLQALVIDPVVDNVARAKEMMETMLRAEGDYLPDLK